MEDQDRPQSRLPIRGLGCLGPMALTAPRLLLAQQNGAGRFAESSSSDAVEILLILVLFGLALFAVCRSSRRL